MKEDWYFVRQTGFNSSAVVSNPTFNNRFYTTSKAEGVSHYGYNRKNTLSRKLRYSRRAWRPICGIYAGMSTKMSILP
ncbi:hypothetical protein bsdcttw_35080 [Anaerocolumna chitinilytica]|uniref:Uncharacterized protein n=1 Tax=Anaerocolumna chitinilytica TaxID=1727145 RepID=A0A7I8DRY0_9FIRM|nr:hypothetical protein bsdcttw_35080 [Anaerocolumna chitinilytica]